MTLKFGDPRMPESFWAKFRVEGNCWIWLGQTTSCGLPRYESYPRRTQVLVHRLLYALTRADVPSDRLTMRTCGKKLCANPRHVAPLNASVCPHFAPRGLACKLCKLELIRARHAKQLAWRRQYPHLPVPKYL